MISIRLLLDMNINNNHEPRYEMDFNLFHFLHFAINTHKQESEAKLKREVVVSC
jgi:hypothetical protein